MLVTPKYRATEDLQQHLKKSAVVVLHESVVCYCSSFDLNSEEWLGVSENLDSLINALC